jgi:hypothetical protein
MNLKVYRSNFAKDSLWVATSFPAYGKMWKEVVMTYSKTFSQNFPGGIE